MKRTLEEMMEWLKDNVGSCHVLASTYRRGNPKPWYCSCEGTIKTGVEIKIMSEHHTTPFEAVSEVMQRVEGLTVNSRTFSPTLEYENGKDRKRSG